MTNPPLATMPLTGIPTGEVRWIGGYTGHGKSLTSQAYVHAANGTCGLEVFGMGRIKGQCCGHMYRVEWWDASLEPDADPFEDFKSNLHHVLGHHYAAH